MLFELAAGLVFTSLAAAPPHLATPLGLVSATTPIKVLLFVILLLAAAAHLDMLVHFALARDNLLQIAPEFFLVLVGPLLLLLKPDTQRLQSVHFCGVGRYPLVLSTDLVLGLLHLDAQRAFQLLFG